MLILGCPTFNGHTDVTTVVVGGYSRYLVDPEYASFVMLSQLFSNQADVIMPEWKGVHEKETTENFSHKSELSSLLVFGCLE